MGEKWLAEQARKSALRLLASAGPLGVGPVAKALLPVARKWAPGRPTLVLIQGGSDE